MAFNFQYIKDVILNILKGMEIVTSDRNMPVIYIEIIAGVVITTIGFACSLTLKFIKFLVSKHTRKRSTIGIKRCFYRALRYFHYNKNAPLLSAISPRILNLFIHKSLLEIPERSENVSTITSILENSEKKTTWICGEAYSGKTTLLLQCVDEITNNKLLFDEFEHNIYFYDLGIIDTRIFDVKEILKTDKRSKSLLIFDNLHKLEKENDLIEFINMLETVKAKDKTDCHMIIISRPLSEFCFSVEIENRFDRYFREKAQKIDLNCLEWHDVKANENNLYTHIKRSIGNLEMFDDFCNILLERNYIDLPSNVAIQLYILYVSNHRNEDKAFLSEIFTILNGKKSGPASKPDLHILSFIILGSLFYGSFDKRWLYDYLKKNLNKKEFLDAKKTINKLLNAKVIVLLHPNNNEQIIFHEKLAQYYFEKITTNINFSGVNLKVISELLNNYICMDKNATAWKYYMLIRNSLFDDFIANANYKTLQYDLEKIISKPAKLSKIDLLREQGVLYDRMGKLALAATCFREHFNISEDGRIYINLIQADHTNYNKDYLLKLCEKKDPYLNLAAKYWIEHINIHKGEFNFNTFMDMVTIKREQIDSIIASSPYDGMHLLRRIYFDSLRCFYLAGTLNFDEYKKITKTDLQKYLLDNLTEFNAYCDKFQYAHYLQYDLLQKKALGRHNEGLLDEANLVLASRDEKLANISIDAIMDTAVKYYNKSKKYMFSMGDKTYRYVDLRIAELEMAKKDATLESIENIIQEKIKPFIADSESSEVDVDEYVGYGFTYKLKALLIQKGIMPQSDDIDSKSGKIFNGIEDEIEYCKNKIKYHHKQYHDSLGSSNAYALFRLEFYDFLGRSINDTKEIETRLNNLLIKADKNNFKREKALIENLLQLQKNASPNDYRYAISDTTKIYPIVLQ